MGSVAAETSRLVQCCRSVRLHEQPLAADTQPNVFSSGASSSYNRSSLDTLHLSVLTVRLYM